MIIITIIKTKMIYFIHIYHNNNCDNDNKDNGNSVANISFCFRFYLYLLVIVYSFCFLFFFSSLWYFANYAPLFLFTPHVNLVENSLLSRPFQGSVLTCLESSLICVNFFSVPRTPNLVNIFSIW